MNINFFLKNNVMNIEFARIRNSLMKILYKNIKVFLFSKFNNRIRLKFKFRNNNQRWILFSKIRAANTMYPSTRISLYTFHYVCTCRIIYDT